MSFFYCTASSILCNNSVIFFLW